MKCPNFAWEIKKDEPPGCKWERAVSTREGFSSLSDNFRISATFLNKTSFIFTELKGAHF